MTSSTTDNPKAPFLWGPFTGLGLAVALSALVLDQAVKLWLLFGYDLANKGAVTVTPFFNLFLHWNTGISFGWFQQESVVGQWALLGFKAGAVVLLWIWMARVSARWSAVSLGLVIGGAIGNAIDRIAYGAVADFAYLHIPTATGNFSWSVFNVAVYAFNLLTDYVFNLADVAIVVGVAGLLYESLFGGSAVKAPRSGP